jgi:glycosyltransferase involved in cell wall biosynthesis
VSERKSVLVLLGAFWPGHEATGPNMSARAMCEALSDEFAFYIIARDRPFGAAEPLVDNRLWHDRGYAAVHYLPVGHSGAKRLAKLIGQTPHDMLMLNSFFDREFTLPALIARRMGRIPAKPALLSPRGEFSGGALSIKSGRKALFHRLASLSNLLDGVRIHATSAQEAADARVAFPETPVSLLENFRPLFALPTHIPTATGTPLRIAFLGRISPVKRLDFAIRALKAASRPAIFDVYGPVGDASYWALCQNEIASLPATARVHYCGEIANADVASRMAEYDVMLLPSLSENFGHAIFEALAAGTPVIIGDQTPWRGLVGQNAGWDVGVNDQAGFIAAIQSAADMDSATRRHWRNGARACAEAHFRNNKAPEEMRMLIRAMTSPEKN